MSSAQPMTPPQAKEMGKWLAAAGPYDPQQQSLFYGVIFLVMLAACVAMGVYWTPKAKPDDVGTLWMVCGLFGGLSAAGAVVMLWPRAPREIHLFEGGIVEVQGKARDKIQKIVWSQIQRLKLREWYENRFAKPSLDVEVFLLDNRKIRFSSTMLGETEPIIEYMSSQVANTEFVPFQG